MQTMDLIQWHGDSIISKIIKWKTGGPASHSGVVVRLFETDRILTLHATSKGCVPWPLSDLLKTYKGDVYWHPLKSNYYPFMHKAFNWMYDRIGTGYDFDGLGKNWFGRVVADARKLFCTEYMYLGWRDGAKCDLNWQDRDISPVPSDMPTVGPYQELGVPILIYK